MSKRERERERVKERAIEWMKLSELVRAKMENE